MALQLDKNIIKSNLEEINGNYCRISQMIKDVRDHAVRKYTVDISTGDLTEL